MCDSVQFQDTVLESLLRGREYKLSKLKAILHCRWYTTSEGCDEELLSFNNYVAVYIVKLIINYLIQKKSYEIPLMRTTDKTKLHLQI